MHISAADVVRYCDQIDSQSNMNRVVLNVGGKRFETTRSTLLQYPDSLLGRMFAPENEHLLERDSDGSFFFDANGECFESIVLDTYRHGFRPLPKDDAATAERMRREYDYWQLTNQREESEQAVVEALLNRAELALHIEDNLFDIVAFGTTAQTIIALFDVLVVTAKPAPIYFCESGIHCKTMDYQEISFIQWTLPSTSFAKYSMIGETIKGELCPYEVSEFLNRCIVADCTNDCRHAIRFCVDRRCTNDIIVQILHDKKQIVHKAVFKLRPVRLSLEGFLSGQEHGTFHCVRFDAELWRSALQNLLAPWVAKDEDRGGKDSGDDANKIPEWVSFQKTSSGVLIALVGANQESTACAAGKIISYNGPLSALFEAGCADLPFDDKEKEQKHDCFAQRPDREEAFGNQWNAHHVAQELKVFVRTSYVRTFFEHRFPSSSDIYVLMRPDYPLIFAERIGKNGELFFVALAPKVDITFGAEQ